MKNLACFLKCSLNQGSTVYAWLCVGGVNNSNDQTKLTEAIFKMHSTVTAAQLIISMISVQKKPFESSRVFTLKKFWVRRGILGLTY